MNRFSNPRVGSTKPHLRPGIKKAANKVFGAAKAVGKVAVKPIKYVGSKIDKEMRDSDARALKHKKIMKDKGWTN